MKKSLRGNTIIVFGLAISILLLALGGSVYRQTTRTVTPLTNDMTTQVISAKGGEVKAILDGYLDQLENIATYKDVKSGNLDSIEEILKDMDESTAGEFASIFYADDKGDAVFSNLPRKNIQGNDYYDNIMIYGEDINMTEASINDSINKPVSILSIPVKSAGRSGIIGGAIDLDKFSLLLEEINLGENSFTILADDKGTVIASSEKEYVLEFNVEDLQKNNDLINILADDEVTIGIYNHMFEDKEMALIFSKIEGTSWLIAESKPISEVNRVTNNILITLIISILVTIGLSLLVIYFLSGNIVNPILKAIEQAENIANLDLTSNIPDDLLNQEDEIGILSRSLASINKSLENFIISIEDTSNDIYDSSKQLNLMIGESTSATEQVAVSINEIADGANEQANSTETGSQNAVEIGHVIEDMISDIDILTDKITDIVSLESNGLEVVEDLLKITENSTYSIKQVSEGIMTTDKGAEEIGQATRLIQEIAEETNLLALNASIEAAHAGEMGRGFAVVAEEIRQLAENSSESANNIDSMVEELQKDSYNTVQIVDSLMEITNAQAESVKKTSETFNNISRAITEAENLVVDLSKSTKITEDKKNEIISILQNLSGIAETNANITQTIAATTEEQLAAMEEVTTASSNMASVPARLKEQINQFKLK